MLFCLLALYKEDVTSSKYLSRPSSGLSKYCLSFLLQMLIAWSSAKVARSPCFDKSCHNLGENWASRRRWASQWGFVANGVMLVITCTMAYICYFSLCPCSENPNQLCYSERLAYWMNVMDYAKHVVSGSKSWVLIFPSNENIKQECSDDQKCLSSVFKSLGWFRKIIH